MTTTSKVAHPRHCTRLSPVGSQDARRPSRPRSSTIAGTRSRAPGAAVSPSSAPPSSDPTATASRVTPSGRPASTTNDAATGSSRLTPRFAHSPNVSRSPWSATGSSASTTGASGGGLVRVTLLVTVSPYAGMTRTGPTVDGRSAVLSARSPGLPHTRPDPTPAPRVRHVEQPADLDGLWARATAHPFLDGVRDGTLPPGALDRWLAQDRLFVADLLAFQARLLARAPRAAQAVLAGGCVALVEELAWFDGLAAGRGLDEGATPLPATVAYAALLDRLDAAPFPDAVRCLWALEKTYLDAWTRALPGAEPYRELVGHWTTPGFRAYVEALGALPAGTDDALLAEVLQAETAFWDAALA